MQGRQREVQDEAVLEASHAAEHAGLLHARFLFLPCTEQGNSHLIVRRIVCPVLAGFSVPPLPFAGRLSSVGHLIFRSA